MKTKIFLSAFIITLVSLQAHAQENTGRNKIHINDLYITAGTITHYDNMVTVTDFKKLAPQSTLLQNDMKLSNAIFYIPDLVKDPLVSAMAGFHLGESRRRNLRLGLSFFTMRYATAQYTKYSESPTETYVSSGTGEKVYENTITRQNYRMGNSSGNIGLDAVYIYNFFPNSGISFFAGIGLGTNFSVYSNTFINYSESTDRQIWHQGENSGTTPITSNENEVYEFFNSKGNFGLNVYIPLGVDLQLGGNVAFLKRTHLLYELRPVINTQFGQLSRYTNLRWQQNIGIKIALN